MSTCAVSDYEYSGDLVNDDRTHEYKSAFRIALDRELFYQRVAGWVVEVEIAIEDAYGADLDTLVEKEWKLLLEDPSYKVETEIKPVIDPVEVAIKAADDEIAKIKKERKMAKSENSKSQGRDWKLEARKYHKIWTECPDDEPLQRMLLTHHQDLYYVNAPPVIRVKQQSRVLGNLLHLLLTDDRGSRRELRAAVFDLLTTWGPALSRDIWDLVLARSMKFGTPSVCHGSEFERFLGPITMDLKVYTISLC